MHLESQVSQLRAALARSLAHPDDDMLRDGLLHRFECIYDVLHRVLARDLAAQKICTPEPVHFTFETLINAAHRRDTVRSGWPEWQVFREARGTAPHAYAAQSAAPVVAVIPRFLDEIGYFMTRRRRHGAA